MSFEIIHRPRRLRGKKIARDLYRETHLSMHDLILPIFVSEDLDKPKEIESMPGVFRWPLEIISEKIEHWKSSGINAFAIFPNVNDDKKCPKGKEILNPEALCYKAARKIKSDHEEILLIADLALDPYTTHKHDGVLDENGNVLNDATIEILSSAALIAADSQYDILAPSDMMDARVGIIRKKLEQTGHSEVCIMSYAAKFCSSFYGPFRDAIGASTKTTIDKSGYQLDPANFNEAKRELRLDAEEGADILMVKPAEPYLDVIHYAKSCFDIPIAAYQVSGEYSRIRAAELNGWLDGDRCIKESLLSIKRAGADMILTYFAERASALL